MRRFLLSALLSIAVSPAFAHPAEMEVLGQAGVLGEWEITGKTAVRAVRGGKEYVGPINLKHSGICTTDGPEQKSGEIRFRLSGAARMRATLSIDGVECTYLGVKSDAFKGEMTCPDRRDVPLLIWLK